MIDKSAVVVGANGFIGRAVVKELVSNGYTVQAVVHENVDNLLTNDNVKYYRDVEGVDILKNELEKSSFFFNFSWSGMKGPLMEDYEVQLENIRRSIEMVDLASELDSKYIYSGSLIEFESFNNAFKSEDPVGRTHVYGSSKFAAHVMSKHRALSKDVDYSCGVITNAYGPGERNPRLITNTLRKIISGEIPQFSAGHQFYDFIYIGDVARAFRLIAERGSNRSYVIGSGKPKPLRNYLEIINSIISPDVTYEYGSAGVSVDYLPPDVFSTDSLTIDTGFVPTISFEEGICKTY